MKTMKMADLLNGPLRPVIDLRHLRLSQQGQDKADFGNEIVILSGDALRLRLIKDKGDVFIQLQPATSAAWLDVRHIGRLLNSGKGHKGGEPSAETSVDLAVRILGDQYNHLIELISGAELGRTLERVDQIRAKEVGEFLKRCGLSSSTKGRRPLL